MIAGVLGAVAVGTEWFSRCSARLLLLILWVGGLHAAAVSAAEPAPTLDEIFSEPHLFGTVPARPAWSADSRWLAFTWDDGGLDARGLWRVRADGTGLLRLDAPG